MAPPPANDAAPPTMLTGQQAKPETTADRFFPSMKADELQGEEVEPPAQPKAQPDEAKQAHDEPEQVDGLPENIRELREGDRDRVMFSPQKTYEYDVPDDLLDGSEESPNDIPDDLKAAAVAELREMSADMGLSGVEVREFITQARAVAPLRAQTVQEVQAQATQALTQLNRELGSEQASREALRDAKQLLARDPRIHQMVVGAGLGNDVKTIRTLAEIARRERARGRLR